MGILCAADVLAHCEHSPELGVNLATNIPQRSDALTADMDDIQPNPTRARSIELACAADD